MRYDRFRIPVTGILAKGIVKDIYYPVVYIYLDLEHGNDTFIYGGFVFEREFEI